MMQTWRDSTSQDYEIKDREVHLQSSTIFSGCKTVRRTGYDSVCSNIQAKGCFFCLFFNKLGIASLNYKDHQLMLKDGKFCYAITAKQLHCVKCAFLAQHRLK